MRSIHVIPHMDQEATGPTQSVGRLCEALVASGSEVEVHTMAAGRSLVGVDTVIHKQWAPLGQFGFCAGLIGSLRRTSLRADIVHNHSLWSWPNMAAGLAPRAKAILLTSPRGTLAPAARARSLIKKRIFSPLQRPVIDRASCLHATSIMEYEDIRGLGLRHPIAVIPNGIDIPKLPSINPHHRLRRLLFLGRLHPIKGVELLLHAWAATQHDHPDWELVIAGTGERTYVRALRSLSVALQLERITFTGAVYGAAKSTLYFSSDLFILLTQTENFGMAVAEAQAHALPVLTTKGAPWSQLERIGSGWWIEREQKPVTEALNIALKLNAASLRAMGLRGRSWMEADFNWGAIATRMSAVYRWLREGGQTPDCVLLK